MKFSIEENKFVEQDVDPDLLAVSGEDKNLSWKELEATAALFERKLRSLGLKSGQAVGILGHKQGDYLAAICACIKLGCPYIPMDDIYPKERISKILYIADVFCQINLETNTIETSFMGNLLHEYPKADDLIYIIFTSGSTGDPKGVQISRESVLSMLQWMEEDFFLPKETIFMNQAPFSFDLSVYEIMYTLNFGKTLILNSREQIKNYQSFLGRLQENKVNTWVSTPSFAWSQCIAENFNSNFLPAIEYFLFCGEILPKKLVKKLKLLFPTARIFNTYGPTEATVATTLVEITEEILNKYETLPIGYPKKGTLVYIDKDNQICIVGANVMKGYLNRQDLNETKMFTQGGLRGFKTGDLGAIKDDLLFCQGRMDDQIKLHGYRIELSEIDHALTKINGIKVATTLPIKRGEDVSRIVSFIKFDVQSSLTFSHFKEDLNRSLPTYMIPTEFFIIDELPMSSNHKIDRKKLLEIYQSNSLKKWS